MLPWNSNLCTMAVPPRSRALAAKECTHYWSYEMAAMSQVSSPSGLCSVGILCCNKTFSVRYNTGKRTKAMLSLIVTSTVQAYPNLVMAVNLVLCMLPSTDSKDFIFSPDTF